MLASTTAPAVAEIGTEMDRVCLLYRATADGTDVLTSASFGGRAVERKGARCCAV